MTMPPLLTAPYFFKDSQNKYSFDLHRASPHPKITETKNIPYIFLKIQ